MYNIINEFKVGDWNIIQGTLYYIQNSIINTPNKIQVNDYFGVKYYESVINVFTSRSKNTLYDYKGKVIDEFEGRNYIYIFSNNNAIYYDRISKVLKYNETVLFQGKIQFYYIFKHFVFFSKDSKLFKINNLEGKNIWVINLENNSEIKKILGIWESELIVACSDGLLISLDIENGELKRSWQDISGFQFDSVIQNRIPKMEIFSLHGDVLIGALHIFYFELDLKTGEIKIENLEEELKCFDIFHIKQTNDNPVTDSHIFLTAMMHQPDGDNKFSYDCLIALNRKTFKIDWQYKFENESLGTNIPKLAGDKLYQLDNGGTLHIFEKEGV